MTSSRIAIEPKRRAAVRFLGRVHRKLQKAYANKPDLTQADIARALGVNRSVVNRRLRGMEDMTLSTVAELSWAMGVIPKFDLEDGPTSGQNIPLVIAQTPQVATNVVQSSPSSRYVCISQPSGFSAIGPMPTLAMLPINIAGLIGADATVPVDTQVPLI